MRHVTLITTGGTIEKTYDERRGDLANRRSIVRRMLHRLRLEDTQVKIIELMSKDSLELTDADRRQIVETVHAAGGTTDLVSDTSGIVILHGTDTLEKTGEALHRELVAGGGGQGPRQVRIPIVLTGAMRPYEMVRSDALQNLTEAIFAAGVLEPGVYCVAHGRVLEFPGVVKDRDTGTFTRA